MHIFSQWGEFIAALVVFFLSHSIPVRPAVKTRIVAKTSALGFTLLYSTLSIAVLTWIIAAAGRAPFIEIWGWAAWQNHVPLIGMFAAILIVILAFGQPNPLSFGGWNNGRFDPKNCGILGWIRHPLLVALLIWAVSHMVPNGNLAHVIVFGLFAAFSLLGMKIIDRRSKRIIGAENWQNLSNTQRHLAITRRGIIRILFGVLIYLALLYGHQWVIGVSPML